MAKKIKKFSRNLQDTPRRGGEKMRRAARQFKYAIIAYIVLVVFAMLIGSAGEYDLSQSSVNGFALCFLLLPAYLPLLLVGFLSSLIGYPVSCTGNEAVWLGICDIFLAVSVWLCVCVIARLRQTASIFKTARIFVLIMIGWGIFQIGCSTVQWMWKHSGFTELHRNLK